MVGDRVAPGAYEPATAPPTAHEPRAADLRFPAIAVAAWAGGLAGLLLPVGALVPVLMGATGLGLLVTWLTRWPRPRERSRTTALGILLAFVAVSGGAAVRVHQVGHNPVAELGRAGASVSVELVAGSDAALRQGRFGDYVLLRARVREVTSDRSTYRLGAPVLVIAGPDWAEVSLGSVLRARGTLSAPRDRDVAAVLRPRSAPEEVSEPAFWWRGAGRVRTELRDSVAGLPASYRPLVPALVVGDDEGLDPALAADFSTTGLTHLLAVSGTNLTLLLGFVLVVARWLGVRGRWIYAVGAAGIVGFVLVARPEPSVLRAAVMGSVALLGLGAGGARRGTRSLGVAVTVLLLVDPWLALLPGFALSVLATAGIVFLAPAWRDALSTWLPHWLAEAVAVPAAAQLACTPVVAALSGQVSLVAVVANLLAAPAVGPATVLGLAGGLVGLVWGWLGRLLGSLAGWCVAWIATVAQRGADLPTPSVPWGSGGWSLVLLTGLCLAGVLAAPRILRRRWTTSVGASALVLTVALGVPEPGWPPSGWVLAACDVGQGDALVLNAGSGRAVVIDVGPDPRAVGRCLDRLEVTEVPLLVLTHFHADHVDGLAGVIGALPVGEVMVSPLADPPEGVSEVHTLAQSARVEVAPSVYGTTRRIGPVTLQVLWPLPDQPARGPGDGSTANDASIVLLARVRGVDVLLTGDIEPPAQAGLARTLPALDVDVLKVPHHGSRHQDLKFLTSLRAEVALVSVGADNDYGHPATSTLSALAEAGTRVLRTDREGDLVVVDLDGRLLTDTSR